MAGIRRRSLALALLLFVSLGFSSMVIAAPLFTDQNLAAGNLNPTDVIVVQHIRAQGDGSVFTTINAVTVQNLGSADNTHITKIEILDGGSTLGERTDLAGLRYGGVTINVGDFYLAKNGDETIRVRITIASAAQISGGETVNFRVAIHYVFKGTSYSTGPISDGTSETIIKGGFDEVVDTAQDAENFNPGDEDVVQVVSFTDDDANSDAITWKNAAITVDNSAGTATNGDIESVIVTITYNGTDYTATKAWEADGSVDFVPADFAILPATVADDREVTITVKMKIRAYDAGAPGPPTDGRTIRPRVTVYVTESGEEFTHQQTATRTQRIRFQGFEQVEERSTKLASAVLTTGEYLTQTIKLTDNDVQTKGLTLVEIEVRNTGTATGAEFSKIEVRRNGALIGSKSNPADFKTGQKFALDTGTLNVADDASVTLTVLYYIGQDAVNGHTLKPRVRVRAQEGGVGGATDFWSEDVTYPDTVTMYAPGFERVENQRPPDGGDCYTGQRLLAQKILCVDQDENSDSVTINPVVVKNEENATGNPDVIKIEITDQDGKVLGSTTSLVGFTTGGVTISTNQNNVVADSPAGSQIILHIYLTIAAPEDAHAGRKIRLLTTIHHSEGGKGYEKTARSETWTIAINHRPTCDFDYTPTADLTYETEITFTAKNVSDADDDDIVAHRWELSDGGTGSGTSVKHTFAAGGTVWAKLTVEDERGLTGSKTKTFSVEPPPAVPVAAFTWTPTTPGVGDEVTFNDTSTTPTGTTITDRSWDLDGDGTEDSDAENPTHTYTAPGTYEVSLTVTNSDVQTDTVTHEVEVPAAKPTADFDYSPTAPDVGDVITFEDKSSAVDPATIETWDWNFGDGSTSTLASPTHPYTTMGTYTVSLTVTDSNEETSNAHTEEIVVGPATMVYSYPNPASDAATIVYRLPEGATDPVLRIFDLVGRLVWQEDLDAAQTTYSWDLTSDGGAALPNGLYVCVVTAQNANERAIKSQLFKLLIDQ